MCGRSAFAIISVLICLATCVPASGADNPYLMRIERQTREEDVCMLLQKDGRYHLERVAAGRARVYEGALPSSAMAELDPLLNSRPLVELKQAEIENSLANEDMDQFLLAIVRQDGWQSLNFPGGKSRKPYKAAMDPLIKWLDRNKQQQNPITGAPTLRCMPRQTEQASAAKPNASNPYVMRIVVDHYEPTHVGAVGSGNTGSMNSAPGFNSTADLKITRLCAVVYESGRYRLPPGL